ncbi:MAG: hypothetical protein ACE5IC_00850 [Candidatus Brocadiales bacterium]
MEGDRFYETTAKCPNIIPPVVGLEVAHRAASGGLRRRRSCQRQNRLRRKSSNYKPPKS